MGINVRIFIFVVGRILFWLVKDFDMDLMVLWMGIYNLFEGCVAWDFSSNRDLHKSLSTNNTTKYIQLFSFINKC